jgi:hypothetical protein
MHTAAIIEMDAERDRKTCVSLDLKVTGANRELARWIADHSYSAPVIAGWLGCGATRIKDLRRWAQEDFIGAPGHRDERADHRRRAADGPLKSQENFQDDNPDRNLPIDKDLVEDAARVAKDFIYETSRHGAWADGYRKIFNVSSFDAEAKRRISMAIDKLISKWRSTQATLARKERSL